MTRFDDNLWREVERRYGAELSEADGPLSSGPRRRGPVIAGASLGVAGASAAAVVVLGAASSSPAFAVTTHRDGTVSVVIRRIDGIPGANRRLKQLGIRVRAVQVDARCEAAVAPALKQVTVATLKRGHGAGWVGGVAGGVNAKIRPKQIAQNRTLVIAAVPTKGQVRLVRGRAVRGAIPGCLPPVARLRGNARWAGPKIVSCVAGKVPRGHGTIWWRANSPATNETTSTGTATTTGPTTATNQTATTPTTKQTVTTAAAATATTTATTGSGTSTGWQSKTTASPAGPTSAPAPPILQACLTAARQAAQVQKAPQGSARAHR